MSRKESGITLVVLVVTIIILMILAGITISSLNESGTINRAKDLNTDNFKKNELEKIAVLIDEIKTENYQELTEEILIKKINKIVGKKDVDYSLKQDAGGNFIVTFLDSKNEYAIEKTIVGPRVDPTYNEILGNVVSNKKTYNSINEALLEITPELGKTTITVNLNITENITVGQNQDVVIDLQYNELGPLTKDANFIINNGKLKIKNGSINFQNIKGILNSGNLELENMSITTDTFKAIVNNVTGTILINNCRIEDLTLAESFTEYTFENSGVLNFKNTSFLVNQESKMILNNKNLSIDGINVDTKNIAVNQKPQIDAFVSIKNTKNSNMSIKNSNFKIKPRGEFIFNEGNLLIADKSKIENDSKYATIVNAIENNNLEFGTRIENSEMKSNFTRVIENRSGTLHISGSTEIKNLSGQATIKQLNGKIVIKSGTRIINTYAIGYELAFDGGIKQIDPGVELRIK